MSKTFYGKLKPISDRWLPEALQVSGFSRNETLEFDDPQTVMQQFGDWVLEVNEVHRPMFISDNNGFDWQFINWYFHHFLGQNPFGHSSHNLGSLLQGRGEGHVCHVQVSAQDPAHAQPGGRRPRQRRGPVADQREAWAEDQFYMTLSSHWEWLRLLPGGWDLLLLESSCYWF